MEINQVQPKKGFALLLSIMVASVLLALGLTMLTITTKQLTLSSVARESEIAFQASAAGLECLQYHVRLNLDKYALGPGFTLPVDCFAISPTKLPNSESTFDSTADGDTYHYNYEITWGAGSGDRCSKVDVYLMVANNDYTVDFSTVTTALQNKLCEASSWCPVIIAEGYNKSCSDVNNGLATVQRELTAF